ncbi:Hypothetical predicted protein, partial [Mytilus galloprovincialis]
FIVVDITPTIKTRLYRRENGKVMDACLLQTFLQENYQEEKSLFHEMYNDESKDDISTSQRPERVRNGQSMKHHDMCHCDIGRCGKIQSKSPKFTQSSHIIQSKRPFELSEHLLTSMCIVFYEAIKRNLQTYDSPCEE